MKLTHLAALVLLPALSASAFADFFDGERAKNLELSQADQSAEVFYQRASLSAGKTAEYTVQMEKGQRYGVFADCDSDNQCTNLDMQWLYNGKVLRQDTEPDTFPLFHVTPEETGNYTIRTIMSECAASSCDYHVQVVKQAEEPEDSRASSPSSVGALSNPNLPAEQFLAQERKANLEVTTGNGNNRAPEVFYRAGRLGTGKTTNYTVNLNANQMYRFFTDCAPIGCENVDMALLHNGRVVEEDTLPDTLPLFTYTPRRSGAYTIRVKMEQCKPGHASCAYHTQVIKITR